MMRREPPPSMTEILAAITAMRAPVAVEDRGLAKHAGTIVTAILLALCIWVGATINGQSGTLSKLSANVENIQKTMEDMKAAQSQAADKVSNLQAQVAQHEQRLSADETDAQRMKERLRILEGQKPLTNTGG